jgi:hypothetical protein
LICSNFKILRFHKQQQKRQVWRSLKTVPNQSHPWRFIFLPPCQNIFVDESLTQWKAGFV